MIECCRAVQMAVWQRQGNGLMCSMSAVDHCGNNAACDGFIGMLKRERIHRMKYATLDGGEG